MSVEMKLGRWRAKDNSVHEIRKHDPGRHYPWLGPGDWLAWRDDGQYAAIPSDLDLIEYLGPLLPTPACAEAGPAGDLSTVSTEDPQESLRRMRVHCNALDRWLSAYKALVAQNERAKADLEEAITMLEKEVEG